MILKSLNTFLKNIKNEFIYYDKSTDKYFLKTSQNFIYLNYLINFIKEIHLRIILYLFFFRIKQPKNSKGCFVYLVDNNLKNFSLHLPLFKYLIKKNWSVVFPDFEILFFPKLRDPKLKKFQFILKNNKNKFFHLKKGVKLNFEWTIDHGKRKAMAEGINFYGTILNLISKSKGTYYPKLNDEKIIGHFNQLKISCDNCLKICFDLLKIKETSQIKKISFSGFEHNYPPTSTFKLFSYYIGRNKDMNFIDLAGCYRANMKNDNEIINSIIFCNVSKKNIQTRFPITRDEFENWFLKRDVKKNFLQDLGYNQDVLFGKNSYHNLENIRDNFLKKIGMKKNYDKIYCLFGHILYDSTIELDEGLIFRDMKDWLNKTIELFKNTNNLLLIKPHPHETHEIHTKHLTSKFEDLIDHKIKNMHVLKPNFFKDNFELFKIIDCSLTWRNISAIESIINNVPTIACAKYQVTECLDFNSPKSMGEYLDLIKNCPKNSRIEQEKARAFFEFYNSKIINYKIGLIPHKFYTHGNPHLKLDLLNKTANEITMKKIYEQL